MTPSPAARDVVLVDAGHPDTAAWLLDGRFDIAVLPGADPRRWADSAAAVDSLGPAGAVWLPARDVRCDAETVALLFALHHELGCGITQPALTAGSPVVSAAELQHRGFAVRFVDPVGLSAPLIAGSVLADAASAMHAAPDGGGLPELLHAVLTAHRCRSAVADCLPVRRTGPVTVPALVRGSHPGARAMAAAVRLGVPIPRPATTHGGLDLRFSPMSRREALEGVLAGWPESAGEPPGDRTRSDVIADLRSLSRSSVPWTGALR